LPEDTYFISTAAVKISWVEVMIVDLGTFLICFSVLLIPSFLMIRKMRPVKALSFD
jgi:lipoprotein-releasing system permease protein